MVLGVCEMCEVILDSEARSRESAGVVESRAQKMLMRAYVSC